MIVSQGSFRAKVEAEHRDGAGNLIARSVSIQAPSPPQCVKPKCIWRFFLDTVFCMLLSNYHYKRVKYAENNRHKKILEKYRTGEDSPENIRQAMLTIVKLGGKQWHNHKR